MLTDPRNFNGLASTLVAATPTTEAHFFGFYDICQFSPDDRELVLLSCPADFLQMPAGEPAEVRIWTPEAGELRAVGTTRAWNWQHGARERWLNDGSVLFNDLGDGRQVARIVSPTGALLRTLPMSVAALNRQESLAVSGNYERLARHYDTYGYHAARNDHIVQSATEDGLWALDMRTGDVRLALSYERLADAVGAQYEPSMFVSHPDFAPDGDAVSFFMITAGKADTSYMRLMLYRFSDDRLIQIAEEKASHPAWVDNRRLWVWTRQSSAVKFASQGGLLSLPGARFAIRTIRKVLGSSANALLAEGFVIKDLLDSSRTSRVPSRTIPEDGHYSRHCKLELMLGDTYPDRDNYLTLLLYSLIDGRRVELARILHDVRSDDARLRCDLHPRWDRSGSRASFDFVDQGVRRVGIVKVDRGIAEAGF